MQTDPNNPLAEKLRQVIADSGLNRLELAKRAGVEYSAVHGFVAGRRDLMLGTFAKLCDALDVTVGLAPKRRKRR